MNSRKKGYTGILFLALLLGITMTSRTALAASAQVELSADSEQVMVGEEFFVYLNISSQEEFGDFEGSLTYDDDILEYEGGSSQVKGSSGYLSISDLDNVRGDTNRKYTMKFEAVKVGICRIELHDRAVVYELEGGEMSVSNNILTINVTAPETASDNARLKSLKVSPAGLEPEFDPEIYDYTMEVSASTEQLVIAALPEDNKATMTVTGNESLAEGENNITISVLAESGNIIEYTIKAMKAPVSDITGTSEEEITPVPEADTAKFEIVRLNGDKYAVYSGQYKLLEPDAGTVIPQGYVKTKMIISDVSVTAFYPQGDMESEFLLIYAENNMGEAGFYRYDRMERTMQRFSGEKTVVIGENTQTGNEDRAAYEKYRTNLTQAAIVVGLLGALCAFLLAVCIRLFLKSRKK